MESMSRTSRGCDLKKSARIFGKLQPATDAEHRCISQPHRLSRRIKNRVKDEGSSSGLIFLHCIFHQESLCKSVVATGSCHQNGGKTRGFVPGPEGSTTVGVRWLRMRKGLHRAWKLRGEVVMFLRNAGKAEMLKALIGCANLYLGWRC